MWPTLCSASTFWAHFRIYTTCSSRRRCFHWLLCGWSSSIERSSTFCCILAHLSRCIAIWRNQCELSMRNILLVYSLEYHLRWDFCYWANFLCIFYCWVGSLWQLSPIFFAYEQREASRMGRICVRWCQNLQLSSAPLLNFKKFAMHLSSWCFIFLASVLLASITIVGLAAGSYPSYKKL